MIKRYDVNTDGCCGIGEYCCDLRLIENSDGEAVLYDDHAAEVERLRAENERLREDLAWMTAEAHAQREAAIYGAAFANAHPHVGTRVAMWRAEDAVDAWRAAQKGGSDG